MKKPISILIIILSIALIAIPVAALGSTTRLNAPATTSSRQPTGTLSAAMKGLRADLVKMREQIRENRLQNEALRLENRSLRLKLRTLLDDVRDDLSAEAIAQLKKDHAEMKVLVKRLADTQGDIKAILATVREMIEQKDWQSVKQAYLDIIAIQKDRASNLQAINKLLINMIKIVEK